MASALATSPSSSPSPAESPRARGTLKAGPVSTHSLLKIGSTGPEVKLLQRLLAQEGLYSPPFNNVFGTKLEMAVERYQRRYHLQVDGIVGQQTWGRFDGHSYPPGRQMLKKGSAAPSAPPSQYAPSTPPPVALRTPSTPGDTRVAEGDAAVATILATARAEVGYTEGPGNQNKFSTAMGRPAEQWCADFVSYCARKAGLTLNTESAEQVAIYLRSKGTWKGRSNPQPGDAVTFRWDGTHGWADHVGIVERVYVKNGVLWVDTIEGNSGPGSTMVHTRSLPADSSVINGFGRIV